MGKHKKKLIALAVFAVLSIAAIPFSPQVEYGLSKMLNLNGEFTKLIFEGGREFTADDIGGGGGSSFDDGGTMTGRLEITPAGTQTATAGLKIGDGVTGGINLGGAVLYTLADGILYSPPFYLSGSGGKSYLRNDSDGQIATVFDYLNIGIPAGTYTGIAQDYWTYFNPTQYKRYARTMAWVTDNGSATGKANFGIAVMNNGTQPGGTSSCQFTVTENGVLISGSQTVTGTSTTTGNRIFGTNTTTIVGGGHVFSIPGTGTKTVTNADLYALSGVSADGQIDAQFDSKLDTVNGSATGLTITNATLKGNTSIEGNDNAYSGSQTFHSNGTMSVGADNGHNLILKVSGSGSASLSTTYGTPTLMSVPQIFVWAGTSSTTGTSTEKVLKTITVPGGIMGNAGELNVNWFWSMGTNTTGISKTWKIYVYDTVATSTIYSRGSNVAINVSATGTRFVNIGSSSVNMISGNTASAPYADGTTALGNDSFAIRTNNPLTVSFAASVNGSETTQTFTLNYFKVITTYSNQ